MTTFLSDIILKKENDIQFKNSAGNNAGKISQTGNDLVLSNDQGDIFLGDGASDVYIGDGVNTVDILFEKSGSIAADPNSSNVTLTIGSSNTSVVLESPSISGTMTLGATTINNKLTFTSNSGYIVFDYEPSTGSNAEYTNEVPLLKVDHAGTEKTVLSRLSNNGALAIGIDDTVAIVAGDTKSVIKDNINYAGENIVFASEAGFNAYGFPNNDTSWSNRNEFRFRSDSATANDNGLYLGDGGSTQFIDISRNLKNINTISSGNITSGNIQASNVTATSLTTASQGDISIGLSYQQGTVSAVQPLIKSSLLAHSPEDNTAIIHPYFFNDFANFVARGGTVTYGGLSANPTSDETARMFEPSARTANATQAEITGSTWSIELTDFPRSLNYGTRFGISFGAASFAPSSMLIEYSTDNGSSYTTALNSSVSSTFYHTYIQNGATAINAVKFTLGKRSGNNGPRVMNIYAYNYDSRGMSEYFVDKGGDTLYGNLSVGSNSLTAGSLDINGNADISGNLTLSEYIYHSGDTTNYHRFLSNRQIFVVGNASSIDLNNGVSTFGSSSAATTLQGSSLAFTGDATFSGNVRLAADLQVGDTTALNSYGALQVNQTSDVDEEGIAVLNSGGTRSIRIYCDSSNNAVINSGDGGNQTLKLNEGSGNVIVGGAITSTGTVEAPTLFGNHADGNGLSLKLGRADNSNYWEFNHAGNDLRIYNTASSGSHILLGVDAGGNVEANNVGIGTAAPDTKLHVAGDVKISSTAPNLIIEDTNGRSIEMDVNGNTFRIDDVGNNAAIFTSDLSTNPVQTTFGGPLSAGSYSLTGGSLDINGNADISGTLDLGGDLRLDLNDNIRFGGQLAIIKENNGELKFYGGTNSTDGGFEFFTWDGSAYNSSLTLKNNNNATFTGKISGTNLLVTGGSVSNTNGVQLAYSSDYAVAQLNGVTGSFIDFSDSSTDYKGRIIYTNSNNKFKFYTNATQALEIDSSQNATFASNVDVGGNLTVPGDIIHDGDTNTKIRFGSGTITLTSSGGNAVGIDGTATTLHRRFNLSSSVGGNTSGGDAVFLGSTETEAGAIYHYNSSGVWELVDASSASTCDGLLAVALGSDSNEDGMLIRGMVTLDHDPGAVGDVLFVSETSGQATATAPTTSGAIVRVIGYCLHATTGQIFFNPDGAFIEVS